MSTTSYNKNFLKKEKNKFLNKSAEGGKLKVIIKPIDYEILPLYIIELLEKYKKEKKLVGREREKLTNFYGIPFNILTRFLDNNDFFLENYPKCKRCGDDINICYYPPFRKEIVGVLPDLCRKCIIETNDIKKCIEKVKEYANYTKNKKGKRPPSKQKYLLPLVAYFGAKPLQIIYHFENQDYELKKIQKCKRCGKRVKFYVNHRDGYIYGYKDYCKKCFGKILYYKKFVETGKVASMLKKRGKHNPEYLILKKGLKKLKRPRKINRYATIYNCKAMRNIKKRKTDETVLKTTINKFKNKGVENPEEHSKIWLSVKEDKTWWENAIIHEGLTVKELSDLFKVSKETIRAILRKFNLNSKKIKNIPEEKLSKMGNLEKSKDIGDIII